MLDIRAGLAKTSTEKYNAMLRTACPDGRIRGLTQFYGAARTGRWAGRLVQMQNLPQNKMPDRDLDTARQLVAAGDLETLELLFDDISGTLSQLIRTAFIPRPGYRFIVSDFSAIEARVIAWLASAEWRMEVFNTHGKIYEASAEQMFHLPKGSVKKGDPMRQKGKIAELALGYGGSVGALKSMGALEMGLEESELKPLVNSWRAANPAITKLWWDTDAAARRTIQTKAPMKIYINPAISAAAGLAGKALLRCIALTWLRIRLLRAARFLTGPIKAEALSSSTSGTEGKCGTSGVFISASV